MKENESFWDIVVDKNNNHSTLVPRSDCGLPIHELISMVGRMQKTELLVECETGKVVSLGGTEKQIEQASKSIKRHINLLDRLADLYPSQNK